MTSHGVTRRGVLSSKRGPPLRMWGFGAVGGQKVCLHRDDLPPEQWAAWEAAVNGDVLEVTGVLTPDDNAGGQVLVVLGLTIPNGARP